MILSCVTSQRNVRIHFIVNNLRCSEDSKRLIRCNFISFDVQENERTQRTHRSEREIVAGRRQKKLDKEFHDRNEKSEHERKTQSNRFTSEFNFDVGVGIAQLY